MDTRSVGAGVAHKEAVQTFCLNTLMSWVKEVHAMSVDTLNETLQIVERNVGFPQEQPIMDNDTGKTCEITAAIVMLGQVSQNLERIRYSIKRLQEG